MINIFKSIFVPHRILASKAILWSLACGIVLMTSRWGKLPILESVLFLIACILVGVATIGRLWCSLYICGYKTKHLVTSGPYSMCRNPLYFFSAVGALGLGFATETFTVPVLLGILFAIFYPHVIRAEETKLLRRHGDAYEHYLRSVPRFWPRLTSIQEPEKYSVSPVKYRQAMFDALWFILILGIIELSEALRETGFLPTIMKLR